MTEVFDPRVAFPNFYGNPAIVRLAGASRWTVSGQIGSDPGKRKAPINIRELLTTGRLKGAWTADETCLLTLDELGARLPSAANCAFHLRAQIDAVMLIDIEPGCPSWIAAGLISGLADETLYSEMSMSGRGYHLLVQTPRNFLDHQNATKKSALREDHGWYEILLEHWITFTRQELIPPSVPVSAPAQDPDAAAHRFTTVADLYESLAVRARTSTPSASSVQVDQVAPHIPEADRIVDLTVQGYEPRPMADFNDDTSRWEFSVMSGLYSRMQPNLLAQRVVNNVTYSTSDRIWLLYLATRQVVPARAKHRETRNNRPFLLDRAAALVADREQRPLFDAGGL